MSAALALAGLTFATGCADDSMDEDDSSTGNTESGVNVQGVVKDFQPNVERQKFEPLSGVTVCVYGKEDIDCDTTNSSGTFQLKDLPPDSNLLLSFEKKNYAKSLRMLATRKEDYDILAETAMSSLKLGIEQAMKNGVDLTTVSGGAVQFFAAEPGDGVLQVALLEGYSATLETLDGEPATCIGKDGEEPCKPFYLDENGEPDVDLEASSRAGVGAFGNVPPGKYKLLITHPDLDCNERLAETGWRADEDNAVVVKVMEEWVTAQVGLFCQPPE